MSNEAMFLQLQEQIAFLQNELETIQGTPSISVPVLPHDVHVNLPKKLSGNRKCNSHSAPLPRVSAFSSANSTATSGPTPMELDQITTKSSRPRGPLTPEEKKRRERENLCRYCGEGSCPGVPDVEQCPRLLQKNAGKVPRRA